MASQKLVLVLTPSTYKNFLKWVILDMNRKIILK